MKIESIKDLDKVIALCRKRGIRAIKIDNIEFQLDDAAPKATRHVDTTPTIPAYAPGGITADTKIDMPDELTPEQLLNWSVGGEVMS